MRTKIIILLSLLFLAGSCKEKNEPPVNAQPEPEWVPPKFYDTIINIHLLHDYLFEPGTYWVYKDSITNIIDTAVVDSIKTYLHVDGNVGGCYFIKCAANMKTSTFPCRYLLAGNSIYLFLDSYYYSYYYKLATVQDNGIIYPDSTNIYYSTYTIDTMAFSDVYKVFYKPENNFWPNYFPDSGYYYFKAGIGIIKSEYYFDGQKSVYEILSYQIN